MIFQRFIEKTTQGKLQGLILETSCAHCELSMSEPLIRSEAAQGEKKKVCPYCNGKNLVKFSPSNTKSERELKVEQALFNIPQAKRKDLLIELAWVEFLFQTEWDEKIAIENWEKLQTDLNYWEYQFQVINDDKSPYAEILNILFCMFSSMLLFIFLSEHKIFFAAGNFWFGFLYIISILTFMSIALGVLFYWMVFENKKRDMGINVLIISSIIFIGTIAFAIIFNDSNVATGGFTLILVVVTAHFTSITNKITEKQWKNDKEPIVIAYLKENEINTQIVDLIIENVGKGIAKNVKFVIHPTGYITLSGDPLEKLFFFQKGIQALSVQQKYVIHLINLHDRIYEVKEKNKIEDPRQWREKLKEELELKFYITYQDIDNEPKKGKYVVNPCMFWGLRSPVPTPQCVQQKLILESRNFLDEFKNIKRKRNLNQNKKKMKDI
ncbi:MAG: hypothetical protein ACYDDV_10775 [Methanoregula sp.]